MFKIIKSAIFTPEVTFFKFLRGQYSILFDRTPSSVSWNWENQSVVTTEATTSTVTSAETDAFELRTSVIIVF